MSAYTIDGTTYVTGKLFNEFSKISINSKAVDTEYINDTLLKTDESLNPDDIIGVVQQAVNHTILGGSENTLIYTNLMIVPDELKQHYLDSLIPSEDDYVQPDSHIVDDATAEFITGAEEHNMPPFDDNSSVISETPSDSLPNTEE
jgi:hypothetical protein